MLDEREDGENPFKPGGDLSNEVETLIECWKRGGGWTFSQGETKQNHIYKVKITKCTLG